MPVHRHAQQRVAPMIFICGVEVGEISFVRNVFAGERQQAGVIVVVHRSLLPFRSPLSLDVAREHAEVGDGRCAGIDRAKKAAADKRNIRMIEYVAVKIGDAKPRAARAHEPVQRFVEKRLRCGEIDLMRQIFSQCSFSRGRVIRRSCA